ncbi:hypothetical protein [Yoonia algicola]|uniref:Uncharacterized protein n=1 Tax=Yoonia algicola TaxID=3137368 RepID=A0AAN0M3R0_9RHOB
MTMPKQALFEHNAEQINARLHGLSAALGDAITDIFGVLKDHTGTVIKGDHVFEAEHGGIRSDTDAFIHNNNAQSGAADQNSPCKLSKPSSPAYAQVVPEPLTSHLMDASAKWIDA